MRPSYRCSKSWRRQTVVRSGSARTTREGRIASSSWSRSCDRVKLKYPSLALAPKISPIMKRYHIRHITTMKSFWASKTFSTTPTIVNRSTQTTLAMKIRQPLSSHPRAWPVKPVYRSKISNIRLVRRITSSRRQSCRI